MSNSRGSVFMTSVPISMLDQDKTLKMVWVGRIHGNGCLWRGREQVSRSLAFTEMEDANNSLSLGAELLKPLPDDHPW